jgi:hypothetical protein
MRIGQRVSLKDQIVPKIGSHGDVTSWRANSRVVVQFLNSRPLGSRGLLGNTATLRRIDSPGISRAHISYNDCERRILFDSSWPAANFSATVLRLTRPQQTGPESAGLLRAPALSI